MKSAQGSPFPLGEPMPPPVLVVLPSEETITTRSVTVGSMRYASATSVRAPPVAITSGRWGSARLLDALTIRSAPSDRFGGVSSMLPLAGITSGAPMLAIGSGRFWSPLERAAAIRSR